MIINSAESLGQLKANIGNMTDEQLRKIQVHLKARLVFPKIAQAEAPKGKPEGRRTFSAVGIVPMQGAEPLSLVGLEALHLITERFKAIHHPNVPTQVYTRCFKNFQQSPVQENGNPHPDFYKDHWWVNMNSGEKFKPSVYKKIGSEMKLVENNDGDIYFGQNVVFAITLYPNAIEPGSTSKRGVGANIAGMFILGGGERIEGKGGGDFVKADANSFAAFSGMATSFDSGSVNPFQPAAPASTQTMAGYTPPVAETPAPAPAANAFANPFGNLF